MDEFLTVLVYAMLPAGGNFAGGFLAEFIRVSDKTLSLALHVAAGIIFAVIGIELMPEALSADPAWVSLLLFVLGGAFFLFIDKTMGYVKTRLGQSEEKTGPWPIYFGVSVDLFTDGGMIGAGTTVDPALGLLLALGQVSADIPEGFATIATLKKQGTPRSKRVLLSVLFMLPVLLGATIGYWGVKDGPNILKLGLLAFTAGILLTVVVEEIMTEAHGIAEEEPRQATMALVGGFALFAGVSVYFG